MLSDLIEETAPKRYLYHPKNKIS